MKKVLLALVLAAAAPAALLLPPADAAAPRRAAAPDFAAAVAAPGRPAEAVALDEGRRPAEVLAFMGLKRGDSVLDYGAGTGYYSEIMGRAVGPTGHVSAWIPPAATARENVRNLYAGIRQRQPNVSVYTAALDTFPFPAGAFDFVLMHLEYHDAYWQSDRFQVPRIEPNQLLRAIYNSVKPGGTVAVVDHIANAGGDTRAVVEALHRIDPATVRADFERAGFVLEAQSDLLRNPQDDHSKLVFDPSIRGHTDRFVYRFRRPR
jgi:predicted methyltransferase